MRSRLASPRFRRRLLHLSITVGILASVAAFFVLAPRHHGTGVPEVVSPVLIDTTELGVDTTAADPDYERRRQQAEAHGVEISQRLLSALLHRRDLDEVYPLVGPNLLDGMTKAEWAAGENLPLPALPGATSGATVVAFSGPQSAGVVSAYSLSAVRYLYAVRVELVDGRWRATYIHEGHAAPFVDERTYAPPGFLPGSAVTGRWWWLSIPGFFVVLIALVAFVDWRVKKGAVPA